jgi:hypothetical protein
LVTVGRMPEPGFSLAPVSRTSKNIWPFSFCATGRESRLDSSQ